MIQQLLVVGLALLSPAAGRTSILARPPLGTRAGFIVNEKPAPKSTESAPPSFVSVGIRSPCAREKSTSLRSKDEASASAASRLRGGSWAPGHTAPVAPQLLYAEEHKHKEDLTTPRVNGCPDRKSQGAQYVASNQRVLEEAPAETANSYEEEEEDAAASRSGYGGVGGGGGGGARAGSLPSFPRMLPNGKAAFAKKFAWVP